MTLHPDPLAASSLLATPKFVEARRHLDGRHVVRVWDGAVEHWETASGRFKPYYNVVVALLADEVLVLRARGLTGPRKPMGLRLSELDQTGPTQQGNMRIRTIGTRGEVGSLNLLFRDDALAEDWAELVVGTARGLHQPRQDEEPAADRELFERLHRLIDDLRRFAGPSDLGRPFCEGYDLEDALRSVRAQLLDPRDVRACGRIMMVEIVTEARTGEASNEMVAIMGALPSVVARYPGADTAPGIAEAAVALAGQLGGPGSMWDLWSERDDVAAEMLCWHIVGRLRMAEAGKMSPVTRPDWS